MPSVPWTRAARPLACGHRQAPPARPQKPSAPFPNVPLTKKWPAVPVSGSAAGPRSSRYFVVVVVPVVPVPVSAPPPLAFLARYSSFKLYLAAASRSPACRAWPALLMSLMAK